MKKNNIYLHKLSSFHWAYTNSNLYKVISVLIYFMNSWIIYENPLKFVIFFLFVIIKIYIGMVSCKFIVKYVLILENYFKARSKKKKF